MILFPLRSQKINMSLLWQTAIVHKINSLNGNVKTGEEIRQEVRKEPGVALQLHRYYGSHHKVPKDSLTNQNRLFANITWTTLAHPIFPSIHTSIAT